MVKVIKNLLAAMLLLQSTASYAQTDCDSIQFTLDEVVGAYTELLDMYWEVYYERDSLQLAVNQLYLSLDDAYEAGKVDGISYYEDEVAPQLLNERWWQGYNAGHSVGFQAGLDDCYITGLADLDGTVIDVVGYYNEVGQAVGPRCSGFVIRKHSDGTHSKYYNQ